MSHVWIVCDVYENDLAQVHLGEYADIRLNAYPDRVCEGTISNIAANLDPNLRTAKVRLEVENPGLMRFGHVRDRDLPRLDQEKHATVPATAILHLHDRDWVYMPVQDGRFPARGSGRRATCFPGICRKSSRASSRASRW